MYTKAMNKISFQGLKIRAKNRSMQMLFLVAQLFCGVLILWLLRDFFLYRKVHTLLCTKIIVYAKQEEFPTPREPIDSPPQITSARLVCIAWWVRSPSGTVSISPWTRDIASSVLRSMVLGVLESSDEELLRSRLDSGVTTKYPRDVWYNYK